MRKESKRILFIEILLFLIALFSFIVFKSFKLITYILLLLGVFLLGVYLLGYERRNEKDNKDVILILLIFLLGYYFVTYGIGFFTGFLITGYSHRLMGILKNAVSNCFLFLFIELIRKVVVKKCKYNSNQLLIVSIVIISFIELVSVTTLSNIQNNRSIVEAIFSFLQIFSKNILLTYLVYHYSVITAIVYRGFMDILIYVIPIVPNFGDYINHIIAIVYPIVILFSINIYFSSSRKKISNSRLEVKLKKIRLASSFFLMFFLLLMVSLVSGAFRYQALTIGSGSMKTAINIGDVVIVDKKERIYKLGEIIAYKHDERILVHRIVEVTKNGDIYTYKTKGDNNENIDNWVIKQDDIIGVTNFKLKYIGWPTVKLSEWIIGGD